MSRSSPDKRMPRRGRNPARRTIVTPPSVCAQRASSGFRDHWIRRARWVTFIETAVAGIRSRETPGCWPSYLCGRPLPWRPCRTDRRARRPSPGRAYRSSGLSRRAIHYDRDVSPTRWHRHKEIRDERDCRRPRGRPPGAWALMPRTVALIASIQDLHVPMSGCSATHNHVGSRRLKWWCSPLDQRLHWRATCAISRSVNSSAASAPNCS